MSLNISNFYFLPPGFFYLNTTLILQAKVYTLQYNAIESDVLIPNHSKWLKIYDKQYTE